MIAYVNTHTLRIMQDRFKEANYTLVSKTHSTRIGPGTIIVIVNTDTLDIIMTVKASGSTVYSPVRSGSELRPYVIPISPISIREVSISLRDLASRLQITDTSARTNLTKLTPIEYSRPFIKTDNEAELVAAYVSIIKDLYKVKLRLCHVANPTKKPTDSVPTSIKIRLQQRSVSPSNAPAPPQIPKPEPMPIVEEVMASPPPELTTPLLVKSPDSSLEHSSYVTAITWLCILATLFVVYMRLTEPNYNDDLHLLRLPGPPLYGLEDSVLPNTHLRHTGVW